MAIEHLVKRTIWIAECKCGERDEKVESPPRERLCKCGEWVPHKEESYVGPSKFGS